MRYFSKSGGMKSICWWICLFCLTPIALVFCLPTIDVFLSSELHSYERLIWLYFSFSFIKSFYILEHSSWVFSYVISAQRKILIVISCKCLQFLARWTKISTEKIILATLAQHLLCVLIITFSHCIVWNILSYSCSIAGRLQDMFDVGRTILAKTSWNLTICGFSRRFQPIYYSAHDSTAEGAALWEFSGWDAEAGWPGGKSHWARQIYGGKESRGHLSSGRPKWEEVQQLSFRVGVTWWRRWLDSNHHQVQSVRAV